MSPRTWLPDPSHYPEQLTPLSATVWFEAIGVGLHRAMAELRGPFGGFEARTELGWAYEGEIGPEWEPQDGALRRAALELPGRWEGELRPRAHEITAILHGFRPEGPPPEEASALLDRMWELVLEQWTIHFLAVIPSQIAAELAHDAYVSEVGVDDDGPLAPYRLLDGPNETTEADGELRGLARLARELAVEGVILEFPVDAALDRLRELADGRAWLRSLDGYLARWGGRARLHELSLPREVERPEMTFEAIRLLLESGSADPTPVHASPPPRDAPALSEVLEAGRFGYALKEDHVYHIDYPGLLATREALLGFGRRLLAEGELDAVDDVWFLFRDDLRAAIAGSGDERPMEVVARNRAALSRGAAEGPKAYLGAPPPRVERHAALEKFYGGGSGRRDARGLRGDGASPGIGEGEARIVRRPEDFRRVRPGDVLVTTTTTPAWTPLFPSLAALVTETGGILCHAAIVAREYGVPAVVGAEGATRRLADGARVRVDGTAGTIELI